MITTEGCRGRGRRRLFGVTVTGSGRTTWVFMQGVLARDAVGAAAASGRKLGGRLTAPGRDAAGWMIRREILAACVCVGLGLASAQRGVERRQRPRTLEGLAGPWLSGCG